MEGRKENSDLSEILEFIWFAFIIIPFLLFVFTVRFLTRFYPFSLLFRDKMYHHRNRHLKSLATLIEEVSKDMGKPFKVESVESDQYFCSFIGRFQKSGKKVPENKIIEGISAGLKTEESDVYLRNGPGNRRRILISRETAHSPANNFGL